MQVAPTEKSLELSKKDRSGELRSKFFGAFPAGAGRAVAVSRIKFPEPAEGVIRVRSASAPYSHRIRTLRASIPNAASPAVIRLYLFAVESGKIV